MRALLFSGMLSIGCESTADSTASRPASTHESLEPPADNGSADTSAPSTDTGTPEPQPDIETIELFLALDPDCSVCVTAHTIQSAEGPLELMVGEVDSPLTPRVRWSASIEDATPVLELHADTEYAIQAQRVDNPTIQSDIVTIQTGPLPDIFPPIQNTVHQPDKMQPGITLLNALAWARHPDLERDNFLIALDSTGRVVWYHKFQNINLALHVDRDKNIYTTNSLLKGIVLNPYEQIETTWNADAMGVDTIHHDVQPWGDGGLAFLSSEHTSIPGWFHEATGWTLTYDVISDVLTTVDSSGHPTWSWSIIDHINPLDAHTADLHMTFWNRPPYDDLGFPKDWSHANAMVPNEGGWLASFRNLDWLIQIDPETDNIDWIFGPGGDFALEEGSRWFSRQHSPAVQPSGSILLYDNGNDRADRSPGEQPFSRVVEYELDHEAGVARELWSWDGGIPNVYSPIVGDVNRLENGNLIISDGAVYSGTVNGPAGSRPHFSGRLREIVGTDSPEVVWETIIGSPDDINAQGWFVYRATRIDSLYPREVLPE